MLHRYPRRRVRVRRGRGSHNEEVVGRTREPVRAAQPSISETTGDSAPTVGLRAGDGIKKAPQFNALSLLYAPALALSN